jgi:hypothetical protein
VDGIGAATYPADDQSRAREALSGGSADPAKFAANLKGHFEKLAPWLKEKAHNYHKAPPEQEQTFIDLRSELHDVYEDLKSAEKLVNIAKDILADRRDIMKIGAAEVPLRSLLFNEYGDVDMQLSAASRTAAQCLGMDTAEALRADSALTLARRARDAADAYMRFAEVFEGVAIVIEALADAVTQVQPNSSGSTAP